MSRFRKQRRRPSLHLAPLIDCVLLLLIFFMLTATYINKGIPVDLPSATNGAPVEKGRVITITGDGNLFLESQPVTLVTLGEQLAASANENNNKIILRTDRSVPVGRVVEVIDITREQGIEVSLMTQTGRFVED